MIGKKGFTDPDVWMSPGVVILTIFGWVAVILGWIWSKNSFEDSFSVWQILIVMAVIAMASYYFGSKD